MHCLETQLLSLPLGFPWLRLGTRLWGARGGTVPKALQNLWDEAPLSLPAPLLEAFQVAISFFTLLFVSASEKG